MSDAFSRLRVAARALFALALPAVATAQCELAKLLPEQGWAGDRFGNDVAISGDFVAVGVPSAGEAGAVDVYDFATSRQRYRLDGELWFGHCVDIGGGLLIVGAHFDDGGAFATGAAYVYDVATGERLFQLRAPDVGTYEFFGYSVALDGDLAVVGAPLVHRPDGVGAAYLFDVTTGLYVCTLTANDGGSGFFGGEVDIAGERAVVSAKYDDEGRPSTGSVYVFDVRTGRQLHKLTASDPSQSDQFGTSVALGECGHLVAGAQNDGDLGDFSGSAYVIDIESGQELFKLLASDGESRDYFGGSVALDDGRILVGATGDDDFGDGSGAVYVFDAATGLELAKLTAGDAEADEIFGAAVALASGRAVVGAPSADEFGLNSGAAYTISLGIGRRFCAATASSTGLPAVLQACGSDRVARGELLLRASRLPVGRYGYFLTSRTPGFAPNFGGSQGNLCLGGRIAPFEDSVQESGSSGRLEMHVDLRDMPPPVQQVVLPGETWCFQAWFRDANPHPTSNFTDAIAVTFR